MNLTRTATIIAFERLHCHTRPLDRQMTDLDTSLSLSYLNLHLDQPPDVIQIVPLQH
jgi:hypothetical protein